jgi:hypothetical protein
MGDEQPSRQRTGDAVVDALIEVFERESFDVFIDPADWSDEADPGEERAGIIAELRDPAVADGACLPIAHQFEAFAVAAGLTAEIADPEREAGYPGLGSHNVTIVEHAGEAWSIDFTASQFGETEFPLVVRVTGDVWRRDW